MVREGRERKRLHAPDAASPVFRDANDEIVPAWPCELETKRHGPLHRPRFGRIGEEQHGCPVRLGAEGQLSDEHLRGPGLLPGALGLGWWPGSRTRARAGDRVVIDDHDLERAGPQHLHGDPPQLGAQRVHDQQPPEVDPGGHHSRGMERPFGIDPGAPRRAGPRLARADRFERKARSPPESVGGCELHHSPWEASVRQEVPQARPCECEEFRFVGGSRPFLVSAGQSAGTELSQRAVGTRGGERR
jgi:hypothetical protein